MVQGFFLEDGEGEVLNIEILIGWSDGCGWGIRVLEEGALLFFEDGFEENEQSASLLLRSRDSY